MAGTLFAALKSRVEAFSTVLLTIAGQQLRGSLLLKWVRHTAAPGIHASDDRKPELHLHGRRLKSSQEKILCRP
jgi:hypothetical protein